MKRSSRLRGEANLFESVHQQLNMYGIAAGAAGVSVLALAQPSEAKIIYTKVNVQISGNQRYSLDLDNDGVADFTLIAFFSHCNVVCHFSQGSLNEKPASGNAAIGYLRSNLPQASALSGGVLIGQDKRFLGRKALMANWVATCGRGGTCKSRGSGLWYNVTNRYLGLRFKI